MKEFHNKIGPFLKSNNSSRKVMRNLLIALLPIILFAIYKNGIIPFINHTTNIFGLFYPLIFIIIPLVITILVELLYGIIILKKKNKDLIKHLKNSVCFSPGIFLGLVLPINTPIYVITLGSLVGNIFCKVLYKITNKNIFNSALIGRLFIIFIYATTISLNGGILNSYEINTIGNIPSIEGIGSYETLVTPYGTLLDFFIGTVPGLIGTTSALLSLLALIYLTITRSIKWKIPVVYILTVFGITMMIANINGLGIWYPLLQIFSGSLIFGAVFLAPDFSTSPVTPIGQVLYGLFLGILTVLFRYLIPNNEGVFISILIMNIFVFVLDKIGYQSRFNFKKSLIPFILAWLFILGSGFCIGYKYDSIILTDPNYTVVSKELIDNKTIYNVSQKDEAININATLIILEGEIISYDIVEQTYHWYDKIKEVNYIEKILKKQNNLDNLPDVDEFEQICQVLKKIADNTLIDYKKNCGNECKIETDFNIISSIKQEDKVIYEVSQKANKGDIKLRIIFKYDVVDSITVVEQNESDFNIILEKNYITTLIENQQVLSELEYLEAAKDTSSYLKEAIIKTKKDYWRNYED